MCHHNRDPDARSKLCSMNDQELITYSKSTHISMDSADLIDELIYRLEYYSVRYVMKEVNSDTATEEN